MKTPNGNAIGNGQRDGNCTAFRGNRCRDPGTRPATAAGRGDGSRDKRCVARTYRASVPWTGTVLEDVTIAGNAATITVSGAAIYEANGQYNNVDAAPADGAVVTIVGAASTVYQPNMFFTKQAFGLGTVKLPKLYSTDTIATTSDGMSIRVSKYADGDANTQKIRFDLLPAYACFNPLFAGQGFGK